MGYKLVSRKGCHLCEEAEQALRELALPFDWLDVDADPALRKYSFRVPVLLHEEKVLAEGRIRLDKLRKMLEEH